MSFVCISCQEKAQFTNLESIVSIYSTYCIVYRLFTVSMLPLTPTLKLEDIWLGNHHRKCCSKCHGGLKPPTLMTHCRPGSTGIPPASVNEMCVHGRVLITVGGEGGNCHFVLQTLLQTEDLNKQTNKTLRRRDEEWFLNGFQKITYQTKPASGTHTRKEDGRDRRGCHFCAMGTGRARDGAAWQTEEVSLIRAPPRYGGREAA